jgi:uncharacterized membrane protein
MRSNFAIMGHPLHPTIAAAAMGLFAWALAANIVFQVRAPEMMFFHIMYWTTIVGLCTGGVAWLVWLTDYLSVARKSDAFGMASAYTLLYLVTLGCYFAAFLIMIVVDIPDVTTGGYKVALIVLEAVGAGFLAISWWIRDDITFRHHLGMVPDTPAEAEAEMVRHAPRGGRWVTGQHSTQPHI